MAGPDTFAGVARWSALAGRREIVRPERGRWVRKRAGSASRAIASG